VETYHHVCKPYGELHDSVTRAQEINQLVTLQQAYERVPKLDELMELWLSGGNEPQLPPVTARNTDDNDSRTA